MNKIAINLICFFFLAYQIQAQVIYERTYPDEFPSIELPIELSDGSTFSMASIDDICVRASIRHIDLFGNENKSNAFSVEAFSSGYHWIGHDSVLIWYEYGAWDVGPDSFHISIWTPGAITKVHTTDAQYDLPPFRKYGAFLYTPEQLLFRKTDTLYLKNLITSVVEDSIIVTGISSIVEFEESILVFRKTRVPIIIDRNLEQIYTWHMIADFPFDTAQIVSLDSFIIYKDESNSTSIQLINVYDESIQQLDLSAYVSSIEDMQSNKGFVFVKGSSINGPLVVQLDKNFQVVRVSSLDIPEINGIRTLRYYPDRVYAWGHQGLGQYNANYRLCYAYQQPEPIELVDLKLDSMWIHSINIVTPNHPIYAYLGISCKITNLSPVTIQSASLHYDRNEPENTCFNGVNISHFENLNILPDATDTIQFQSYSIDLIRGNGLNRQYILEHGNHHLDGDTSNNTYNLIYTITATEQIQREVINVYPNPFTDILYVSFPSIGVEMVLYDQTGRMVSQGQDQLNDVEWLQSGVYFLRISNGNSTTIQKVVKVE